MTRLQTSDRPIGNDETNVALRSGRSKRHYGSSTFQSHNAMRQSNNPQPGHLYVWFERVYQKQNGEWKHLSHRTVKGPVREDDSAN